MGVNHLYIASLEPNAGTLIVVMGFMELIKSRLHKIAYFKPITIDKASEDTDIQFLHHYFKLDQSPSESSLYTFNEVEKLLSQGDEAQIIERIIDHYHDLVSRYDFVIVHGFNPESLSKVLPYNLNHRIAKNLQAPYLCVYSAKDKTNDDLYHEIALERFSLANEHVESLCFIINRMSSSAYQSFQLTENIPTFCMKEVEELNALRIIEIHDALNARLLLGKPEHLDRSIKKPKIAAMNVEHILERFEEGDLIIVPGDRVDIILSAIYVNNAQNFPSIAGIILTGGLIPDETFLKLLKGGQKIPLPILCVETDTYETTRQILQIRPSLRPHQDRKIALAMGEFMSAVEPSKIFDLLQTASSKSITPAMFEYRLYQRAHQNRKRIVLPETNDERILRAADILLRRDAVDLILLGEPKTIHHHASVLNLDLSKATVIDPFHSPRMQVYVDQFYSLRQHKGLTLPTAKDALTHRTYFGTMMVYNNEADGMVSGAIHTTQETILPALQIIKTLPNISLVSSLFFMCLESNVLVYADCAVNQDPNAQELAQIAIASALSAQQFGIEPRIAMLSYSTGNSGHGSDVEKVREATRIVQSLYPNLLIEGPIQYDAAIDPEVAKIKLPSSPVAGQATIFIFPDLNTGNNTYKAVQRSSGAIAIGPILQGLKKPINDLSRGCTITDIVNTVLITAIQAQGDNG